MLFNSFEFILGFLPVVAIVFFIIGTRSKAWALNWVIIASIFFYAWWRPLNLAIIGPSILVNYGLARALVHLRTKVRPGLSRFVLIFGIAFNLGVLGYFKYANFFVDTVNDVFGTGYLLAQIILPLGISFITFQKIAFLIDVHAKRVDSFRFQEYCLFVLFFPQLIAGPIVHYREMMPQFRAITGAFHRHHVTAGLTLFFIGLCKKVFLADSIAPTVSGIYEQAALGEAITFFPAWIASAGFTLQIYFDFSGYTDMALGAARLFGIRLPPNFDSPLRATSIIAFWSRWHMTLTRFLTAYVYNPLSLSLARRRMSKQKTRPGRMGLGGFLQLLAFPTLLTMFLSGLWHGAGYTFILWGILHGFYLVVNHAWRQFGPGAKSRFKNHLIYTAGAFVLTALCIVASMVLFRAPTVQAATAVFEGMVGLNGIALPDSLYNRMGSLAGILEPFGLTGGLAWSGSFVRFLTWLASIAMIAYLLPNSLQIMRKFDPALGWKEDPDRPARPAWLQWRPSLVWAAAIAVVVFLGASNLGRDSEFLYWQF